MYDHKMLVEHAGQLLPWVREHATPVVFIAHDGGPGAVDEARTPGFEILPHLAPVSGGRLVVKTSPDSFLDTGLQPALDQRDVRDRIIAVLKTGYYIDTSCQSARNIAYEITVDSVALFAARIVAHHNSILGDTFITLSRTQRVLSGRN